MLNIPIFLVPSFHVLIFSSVPEWLGMWVETAQRQVMLPQEVGVRLEELVLRESSYPELWVALQVAQLLEEFCRPILDDE